MRSTCYSDQILMKLEFSQQILKNNQISYFTKICPIEAEFFHADGWIDGRT